MILIPLFWTERAKIPNLPTLLESYHANGGSIIQYDRVFSLILVSFKNPVFEWVPPSKNRRIAGIKHALFCGFLGWWSITGFFWTASAVINNLMGGIDVTRVLTTPPPLPGQPQDSIALQELKNSRKRQQIAFLVFLLLLLSSIIVFVVIPRMDK